MPLVLLFFFFAWFLHSNAVWWCKTVEVISLILSRFPLKKTLQEWLIDICDKPLSLFETPKFTPMMFPFQSLLSLWQKIKKMRLSWFLGCQPQWLAIYLHEWNCARKYKGENKAMFSILLCRSISKRGDLFIAINTTSM